MTAACCRRYSLSRLETIRYRVNKSHSAAYSYIAYYTAYLKYHYPKEYSAAVLNDTEFDKFDRVIKDAQRYRVTIELPDVNKSFSKFTPYTDKNAISYGLSYIKQVASYGDVIVKEREANGLYKSVDDFMQRTGCRKDTAVALACAGALDDLAPGSSIASKRNNLLMKFDSDDRFTDRVSCLITEKSFLGSFLRGNPAADITVKDKIANLAVGAKNVKIACVILNVTRKFTKNGEEYAIIHVEDPTGAIYAACYTNEYASYKQILQENTVVILTGYCKDKKRGDDSEEKFQFVISSVEKAQTKLKTVIVCPVDGRLDKAIMDTINAYKDEQGVPVKFKDAGGRLIPLPVKVTKEIFCDTTINHLLVADRF